MKRLKINLQIVLLLVLTGLIFISCNQSSTKEVSAPQADFNGDIGINESDSIVTNIVDLNGLYRVKPADNSLSVDIKVDFKDDNNSTWITNINGNIDEIPKKYRVFADVLYITHDLQEFNRIIEEQRKKDKGISVDLLEEMISKIPVVDKYKIELTDSDTIKLFGSRVNFNLIKEE